MLSENITNATQMVMQCLLGGIKVIACGVSRSYANAQFLVSNLLNRYDLVRPSFPSVLLSLESAVGSSLVLNNRLKNCIVINLMPLQKSGDLLIAFAPLGTEKIVLNIISHAVSKKLMLLLTGSNNDAIQGILADKDLEISIPATKESRILENHLFVINALCELVDQTLFPSA